MHPDDYKVERKDFLSSYYSELNEVIINAAVGYIYTTAGAIIDPDLDEDLVEQQKNLEEIRKNFFEASDEDIKSLGRSDLYSRVRPFLRQEAVAIEKSLYKVKTALKNEGVEKYLLALKDITTDYIDCLIKDAGNKIEEKKNSKFRDMVGGSVKKNSEYGGKGELTGNKRRRSPRLEELEESKKRPRGDNQKRVTWANDVTGGDKDGWLYRAITSLNSRFMRKYRGGGVSFLDSNGGVSETYDAEHGLRFGFRTEEEAKSFARFIKDNEIANDGDFRQESGRVTRSSPDSHYVVFESSSMELLKSLSKKLRDLEKEEKGSGRG
jgi:hypothetical protein